MKDLKDVADRICELKGENMALLAVVDALLRSMSKDQLNRFITEHTQALEVARVTLLNSERAGDGVLSSFERYSEGFSNLAQSIR
ncbi:putative gp54 [Burkholderia pseudomallei]|uniref:Gp54 n=1 Tax=Burkholderia pseudomallei TaxID=28450 RepID=A0AA40JDA8_BURPE|nr:hypothetical protein [Burkholderia pseudomallei]AIS91781.1 putative gp54 [Burkholderia pseudomallei NAU35A-3]KGV92785.1 putative gp54 [Burkholderia pseudomallei MSHR3960]AHE29613.1 putative gp54 [Burkholderia pseudomallei NCTC 13178]AHE32214.1 putative gp54 [Burkholderia pseudomallei NAU20B-16]AHG35974.1 putative gp54 [Burkholderia pseudomallei MSHR511]